jgi:hypothetical protein
MTADAPAAIAALNGTSSTLSRRSFVTGSTGSERCESVARCRRAPGSA